MDRFVNEKTISRRLDTEILENSRGYDRPDKLYLTHEDFWKFIEEVKEFWLPKKGWHIEIFEDGRTSIVFKGCTIHIKD
jgi:hypothetical protein